MSTAHTDVRDPALRNFRQQGGLGFAIALCALLFALTFRALLPTGYMLEAQADGVELVLCGSNGLQTVIVDADGRPVDRPDHPEDRKAEAACVFAGVAAIAPDEPPSPLRSTPQWTARPMTLQTAVQRDMRNPRGPPPPLRGPPLLMI